MAEQATDGPAKRRRVDFTNVREGGGFSKTRMPEGDYAAKITKVTERDKDGVPMWCFAFQLKARASATYPYYCKLQENQLWKLRNLLIAAGKAVPKKAVNVDPNNLIGAEIAITLVDAEYEGREQSEVEGVFPVSELADDEPEATGGGSVDVDDDVADDVADDETGDLDLDDL